MLTAIQDATLHFSEIDGNRRAFRLDLQHLNKIRRDLSVNFFTMSASNRPQEERREQILPDCASTPTNERDDESIERRAALLDEKLKLHERIIDEFNLTLLEKLPQEELLKQVRAYVANYVRTERISLNQKELERFSDEI